MDKLAKKILDFAIDTAGTTGKFFSVNPEWDSEADTSFQALVDAVQAPPADVLAAVKYLAENGFVEYRRLNSKHGSINLAFRLTHTGLHYKEISASKTKDLLLKSVALPIAVSMITTLTIDALKWLWPQILQWIIHIL